MGERVFATCAPGIIDGGFDVRDGVGLYRTASASKARYLTYLSAKDAGFALSLTDVLVRRAPEYDRHTFKQGSMPSYAKAPVSGATGGEG